MDEEATLLRDDELMELLDKAIASCTRSRKQSRPSFVYFAWRPDRDAVKIGCTTWFPVRMYHPKLQARRAVAIPGTTRDERALHERFDAYRLGVAEWFALAPEIIAFIEEVKARPDAVSWTR